MICWVVGLSGSGKTTIGRELYYRLKNKNKATVFVDGDSIRRVFQADGSDSDYSIQGRRRNAERIFEICSWLDKESMDVVCCILAIFPDILARNREAFSDYFEVFVDVPVDTLIERDDKGVYRSAAESDSRNVVGVDIPFPIPKAPDLIVDNSTFSVSPRVWAERIMIASEARERSVEGND